MRPDGTKGPHGFLTINLMSNEESPYYFYFLQTLKKFEAIITVCLRELQELTSVHLSPIKNAGLLA